MFYKNPHRLREIRIPPAAVGRVRPNDYEACGSKVPSPHLLSRCLVSTVMVLFPFRVFISVGVTFFISCPNTHSCKVIERGIGNSKGKQVKDCQ